MFPHIKPFRTGRLRVADGNEIYWEASGNPDGRPALYLHGGPGGGVGQGYRRHFDPDRHMIVSFDQRGCGRSRPLVTDAAADLGSNTTQAIIADMEELREHLGVRAWLIVGASWGTALALACAQAHPDRVSALVLALIHVPSAFTVDWITEQMRRVFPREWDECEAASRRKPGQRMIEAYYELITHPERTVREDAARAWCRWEDTHMSLDLNSTCNLSGQDLSWQMVLATLVIHYWRHSGFMDDHPIMENMHRMAHLPGVLIHGRLDISSPLETAWDVHRRWPGSELIVIPDEGHGGPRMVEEINRAVARLGGRG